MAWHLNGGGGEATKVSRQENLVQSLLLSSRRKGWLPGYAHLTIMDTNCNEYQIKAYTKEPSKNMVKIKDLILHHQWH